MKRLLFALAALLVLTALPAFANWTDPNVKGTQEYRLFKFYPEARVRNYAMQNFDSMKMLTAYRTGDPHPTTFEEVEGRVIHYVYEHKPTTSMLEVVRNYETLLTGKGFETIVAGKIRNIKGLPGGDEDAVGYWRWQEPGKGLVYVHVFAHGGLSEVDIVETKAMEQKLEANAGAMLDALQKTGRVAVYGINFDTAKATIRPESDAVLQQVLKLLTNNPQLQIAIEGHTDNAGAPTFNNKRLSEDRAGAVKFWLVGHGIDSGRLDTAGFGDTHPVADNATEDGRAKNRRVELVRQ